MVAHVGQVEWQVIDEPGCVASLVNSGPTMKYTRSHCKWNGLTIRVGTRVPKVGMLTTVYSGVELHGATVYRLKSRDT